MLLKWNKYTLKGIKYSSSKDNHDWIQQKGAASLCAEAAPDVILNSIWVEMNSLILGICYRMYTFGSLCPNAQQIS